MNSKELRVYILMLANMSLGEFGNPEWEAPMCYIILNNMHTTEQDMPVKDVCKILSKYNRVLFNNLGVNLNILKVVSQLSIEYKGKV